MIYDETFIDNVIKIKERKASKDLIKIFLFIIFLLISIIIIPLVFYFTYYQGATNIFEVGWYFTVFILLEIMIIIFCYLLAINFLTVLFNYSFCIQVDNGKMIMPPPEDNIKYKSHGVIIFYKDIEKIYWRVNNQDYFDKYFFILMKQPYEKKFHYKILWYEKKLIVDKKNFIDALLKNDISVIKSKKFNPGDYYRNIKKNEQRIIKWIDFPLEKVIK